MEGCILPDDIVYTWDIDTTRNPQDCCRWAYFRYSNTGTTTSRVIAINKPKLYEGMTRETGTRTGFACYRFKVDAIVSF